MNNKRVLVVLLLVIFGLYFYLSSMSFAYKFRGVYDRVFYSQYCDDSYREKRGKLINQNIIFSKFMGVFFYRYISEESTNKDVLINYSRLAINELENGNKEQYFKFLSLVEKDVEIYFPTKSALEYIQETNVFDESICSKVKGK